MCVSILDPKKRRGIIHLKTDIYVGRVIPELVIVLWDGKMKNTTATEMGQTLSETMLQQLVDTRKGQAYTGPTLTEACELRQGA